MIKNYIHVLIGKRHMYLRGEGADPPTSRGTVVFNLYTEQ